MGEKTTYNCTLGHATTCHLFLSVSQIMVEGFLLEMTTTISATKKEKPEPNRLVSLISNSTERFRVKLDQHVAITGKNRMSQTKVIKQQPTLHKSNRNPLHPPPRLLYIMLLFPH